MVIQGTCIGVVRSSFAEDGYMGENDVPVFIWDWLADECTSLVLRDKVNGWVRPLSVSQVRPVGSLWGA